MKKIYRGDHSKGEIELLEEVTVFKNGYATLYNDRVKFPSGKEGEYLRFWWNTPYGVIIIPTTQEQKLLLIRNFRHEDRNWQWEIPKGFGVEKLTPEECAAKELGEETGFKAERWELLHQLDSRGIPTYVYRAHLAHEQKAHPEYSEAIAQARLFTLSECKALIANNEVQDPITLYAISQLEIEMLKTNLQGSQ